MVKRACGGSLASFKVLSANVFAVSLEFEVPNLPGPWTTELPGRSKRPKRLVRGKGTKKTAKIRATTPTIPKRWDQIRG
jgi:hypothetical protein